MTHVKICGFQSPDAAVVAAEAGADAVGLVFVPTARRRVTVVQGEAIVSAFRERGMKEIVGMFADQPADEVNMIAERLGLDAVQLCGAEGMGYCKELRFPILKVVAVDATIPVSAQLPKIMVLLQRHSMAGHSLVLDAKASGEYGGTGIRFDAQLAADLAQAFPLTVAGGLTPENVAEVVTTVRPWGVDTSSGVETDGEKAPEKVRAFVRAVREADASLHESGLRRLLNRMAGRA
ncbi:MAG: phosphoribosylanthranilate isomerase [Dehalococcoidia bacterium]